jgi:outer membrane receptor protein involved in Fe transport
VIDRFRRSLLAAAVATVVAPAAAPAFAEEIEEIVVRGELFRSRENTVAPLLIYDLDYFQQLEPISVGDMLKRVPGVAFTSDIGEYDAPQLRGLATQYTQILVNGRRIPGAGKDRSVFVDRIPAEIVERVEIVRSPTPDLDAQGVAGTLNIILKDGASLEGGEFRASATQYTEELQETKGAGTLSYGDRFDGGNFFLLANVQERYAPKGKFTQFMDDEGEPDGTEVSEDVRDSTDTSLSASVQFDLAPGRVLGLEGAWLETDRDEDEFNVSYDDDGARDEREFQHENIEQQSGWVQAFLEQEHEGGGWKIDASYAAFDDDTEELSGPVEQGAEVLEGIARIDTEDEELKLGASYAWTPLAAHRIEVGLDLQDKTRDASQREFEFDDGDLEEETAGSGVYEVEENRADLFLMDTWTVSECAELQYGLRGEYTDLALDGSDGSDSRDDFQLNPSAHLVYRLDAQNQLRLSLARTQRRPDFDQLVPFTDEDSPSDDQETIGNPELEPETAIGFDAGYEHRFAGAAGILGLNAFYRDIEDVIELVEIGDDLFTPDNVADGKVWGLEFDMSVPLDGMGLRGVGVFANATWLDSEIDDPFTGEERRFNLQPEYVYNLGFFHEVESWDFSWGGSYQKQGDSELSEADGFREISYDGNLEFFAEKRFWKEITLRLVASNLLDAEKVEDIVNFDSLDDRIDGVVDDMEREQEETGPVYSLTVRVPF